VTDWVSTDEAITYWASTNATDAWAYRDEGETIAYNDEGESLGVDVNLGGGDLGAGD